MKSFYAAPVYYFEVTFTLPNPRTGPKMLANFEREIREIFNRLELDVRVSSYYGKGFDTAHFELEFADQSDYEIAREDLLAYLQKNNVL